MKKILPLVIILVLLLAAGAGIYLAKNKSASNTATTSSNPKSTNVFNSIADALSNKALSLSCDFTDTNGTHVMAYIKNGAIRSDVTGKTAEESGSVLIKDKKMYFWNAQMGIMMDMSDSSITPVPTSTQAGGSTSSGQNTLADLEKYKESCKPAVVADNLFDIPTNIKFTDESQMMKQIPTVAIPTSSEGQTGSYAVPTQYQQYMPH